MPDSPQARTTEMPAHHPVASKMPIVTASFWILKILTTGMGEAASDALVRAFGGIAWPSSPSCGRWRSGS